jgi:hypothetical protein
LKNVVGTWIGKLKGKDRFETLENYSILFIFIGAIILSAGIGLNILNPKGLSAVLSMFGSLIAFVSTIALIIVWLLKEFKSG